MRTMCESMGSLSDRKSRVQWSVGGIAALGVLAAATARAEVFEPALNAMRETKPIVDLRLRSESVDQAGMAEEAEAVTLRARLGFETGKAWSTALLADADLLWPLDGDYNSTVNSKTLYPIVADPETYEINRLQLTNTSIAGTAIILGRQRINLDDQRFVGSVGWRQNEQTFDAVRVTNATIRNLSVDVTYLNLVNRVFGKDSPVGRYHGDSYLMNVAYQTPIGKLSGFGYLLDFEEAQRDSSQTLGVRLAGERPVQRIKLAYSASYAKQREYADNPLDYEDDFLAFELTGTFRQYSLGGGMEVLYGDGVKGFATPLATLHKFDGWADKFLTTPPNGLERRYVTLGYLTKGVGVLDTLSANATYHEFESERLAIDYGSEVDLQLTAKWQRLNMMIKYARYEAERFATDASKFWVQVDFAW
jgi:hypothetical protein